MEKYSINLDDYKKIKPIGEGGFGKVYLIENKQKQVKYAAKIKKKKNEEEDEKDLNEVFTLIKVNHPAILNIIGYNERDFKNRPRLTIILEYMPNGTLQTIIDKRKKNKAPNGWTDTKTYINLLGVAIGMKYLHSKKIVQRDLKPLNILLDSNYYPRISDFGFSKTLDSMRSSNFLDTQVGTVAYMAPEILANQPYNYKVDIYAYSMMAYEIITANSTFSKFKTVHQFIKSVIEGYRPDTSSIEENYSEGHQIVELLQRCWSNNPSERPTFPEIVEILEEKWFYSKFNVDENEVKEYLKLFEGESLKEDILEPTSLLNLGKTAQESVASSTLNINKTTQDSSAPNSLDYLDMVTTQTIEKLISNVFDQPFFSPKKIKDIKKSSLEDSLLSLKNIQKKAIQKKPYEDFIPTIMFQLDKPLKDIEYDKLQEVIGEDAVILNIESYHTNLQNGFLSIEDYEPELKEIPTILQIAPLSINVLDPNIKGQLDEYIEMFLEKLNENQSAVGNIVDKIKIKICIPSDEDIKSVFCRPSVDNTADYNDVDMNMLRLMVHERLQDDKNNYNWKFVFEHEDLYKQMNEQIWKDLEANPYELAIVNQTIFPNDLLDEKIEIPERQSHECFLYNGSIIKENGFHGEGFYATNDPFMAALHSNGFKILGENEGTQIFCCRAIYNTSKVNDLTNSSSKVKPFDDDYKNNYGVNIAKYTSANSATNAQEYVFPSKAQLIPLCSFTIVRKDHYILWRDTSFINPGNFKFEEAVALKKLAREMEINVYIRYDNDDALNIIKNKIYPSVKLITNGGACANGKVLIEEARKIIGSQFICLVFANSLGHMEWISKMKNVLFSSIKDHFCNFVKLNMKESDILAFESDLRNYYTRTFDKNHLKFWNLDKSELLKFPESNYKKVNDNEAIPSKQSNASTAQKTIFSDANTLTAKYLKEFKNPKLMKKLKIIKRVSSEKIEDNLNTFYKILLVEDIETSKKFLAKVFYVSFDHYPPKLLEKIYNSLSNTLRIKYPSIFDYIYFSKDGFSSEMRPTLFTEFVGNSTLEDVIVSQNPEFDATKKLINIYGIASGMQYLHSMNILHLDLTLENIIEDSNFYPKIKDFGMSGIFKDINSILRIKKKNVYLAPECYINNEYDEKCDVYSFSLIVYQIMTNKIQFKEINVINHIDNIIKNKRPELDDKIPEAYIKLIEKCWSSDPKERLTFEMIVDEIEKNPKFITKDVNEDEFKKYIQLFKSCQIKKMKPSGSGNNEEEEEEEEEKIDPDDKKEEKEEEEEEKVDPDDDENLKEILIEMPFLQKNHIINIYEYEEGEKIGEGGTSIVYKAIKINQKSINYAAKVFLLESDDYRKIKIDVAHEVEYQTKLTHLLIPKFIGYSSVSFDQRKNPLTMIELLKNGSLCDVVKRLSKGEKIPELDEKKILDIIIKIATAMNYLHSQGIIHRDLKLANILLDESFNPKLSDFGLLMKDSEKSDEDVTVGTGPYIAPEIWENNNYSKASDVYAFGILVYELVTKKIAFKGKDDNVIMYTISIAKKRPQLDSRVSAFYKNLISSCWDDDPEKRPTFSKIIDDLNGFQQLQNNNFVS